MRKRDATDATVDAATDAGTRTHAVGRDVLDGTDAAAQLEAAQQERDEARRELNEERDRGLRLLAEFDTYRRRAVREHDRAQTLGRRAALTPLLAVLDSLEQAIAAGSTDRAFFDGVVATRRMFLATLREAGAEPIESVGRPFDPRLHEVVATAPAVDGEPGVVLRELRGGWRLGDEVMRPAQVEVAAATERDSETRE